MFVVGCCLLFVVCCSVMLLVGCCWLFDYMLLFDALRVFCCVLFLGLCRCLLIVVCYGLLFMAVCRLLFDFVMCLNMLVTSC